MAILCLRVGMKLGIKPLQDSHEIEVQVTFRLPRGGATGDSAMSFEQIEEALAKQLNDIGSGTTKHLLGDYDSAGGALQCQQGEKWTTKGRSKRLVETPYGAVPVLCHVYQTRAGGTTRVPLAERARLLGSATPRMAKMTAAKLAEMSCAAVARDLECNHLRPLSKSFAQDLGTCVAALVTTQAGQLDDWQPRSGVEEVALIAVGVDGAHLNTRQPGWRQSMAGTLALYDRNGERLETLYAGGGPGETPPQGKATFFNRMDLLLARLRSAYPKARVVGLSDGAVDLQSYPRKRCDEHLLDFHHAAEYLSAASAAFSAEGTVESAAAQAWAQRQRATLRDEPGGALQVLACLRRRLGGAAPMKDEEALPALNKTQREALQSAETYYINHLSSMDYAGWQKKGQPIGSGVTEAACKTLIKQRMCQSGMRWSIKASDALISLRALYLTPSRWEHFWKQHSTPLPSLL
jgi:hypothetical protein